MALIDHAAGIIVTAAPGTGSTALLAALGAARHTTAVPADDGSHRVAGVDVKHGTVTQLVAAELLPATHGMRIVTATRNPFDFYVAEWGRTRTRWVHELADPDSWVHTQPGAVERITDAVTLEFDPWLRKALGADDGAAPSPRRINAGHVDEADVVLRMESLEADLADLLGIRLAVPRRNVTDRDRDWRRHYSPATLAFVAEAHAADLERFGYAP
jgi:hypothetical protein